MSLLCGLHAAWVCGWALADVFLGRVQIEAGRCCQTRVSSSLSRPPPGSVRRHIFVSIPVSIPVSVSSISGLPGPGVAHLDLRLDTPRAPTGHK